MRNFRKPLWAAAFMLSIVLMIAWFMLPQNGTGLPSKVLEKMVASASSVEQTLMPKVQKQTVAIPNKPGSAIPQTTTYYRWTDNRGQTGYSADLPENVSSFKAIVLDRQP